MKDNFLQLVVQPTKTYTNEELKELWAKARENHTNITMVPIGILITNPDNVNEMDEEHMRAVEKSIDDDPEFMLKNPILVNTYEGREGFIISGNHRKQVCVNKGWNWVPVLFDNCEKNLEHARALRANAYAGHANPEKMALQLQELKTFGFNMEGLGFTPLEMVDMMEFDLSTSEPVEANPGTTPAQEVTCPECGAVFKPEKKKKDRGSIDE